MVKMAAEEIEKALKTLPADDLHQMVSSLQDIISQLVAKQTELKNLEETVRKSEDEDAEETLKEIEIIRVKIIYLIDQSRVGLDRVIMAQGTRNKQGAEIQKFTILFAELESWLENARNLLRQSVNPNSEQEVGFLIQALENLLKELRVKSQDLIPVSTKLQEFERDPDLVQIFSSLKPRLDSLRREFSELDQTLKDRIDSLQEIHVVFINRRKKTEEEPVVKPLEDTKHDQESKLTPIFVPKARKGDSLSKPDGSLTNVCRVEEAFTTFLPPQSTDSTFKPIPMSESRKPKHRKPPTITTESYEDPSGSPPDEYSAEQVSQKVFDFLEIDQPERDDAIDSRASPIPSEEVIDLESPRFEYYEEIKFKKPVLYGQTRHIEKHDFYETTDVPEVQPEYKEYLDGKQMLVEEIEQPEERRTITNRYKIKEVDPKQFKEYKYVRIPTESEEPFDVSSFEQQAKGTRTILRTIPRRIIRKVVIINGVETVTEEVVEEPVEETVLEFDEHDNKKLDQNVCFGTKDREKPKGLKHIEIGKNLDSSPSESLIPNIELERKIKSSFLRPEAKEFTPSSSLSKSTDIGPQGSSILSADSVEPTKFDFITGERAQLLTQTSASKDPKQEDASSNVVSVESIKGIKPQRKKKKKRRSEKAEEESEKSDDDFASENEFEPEESDKLEKICEENKKPKKQSFIQTLVFGRKERTPEDAKSKDNKSTRKIEKTGSTSDEPKKEKDKTTKVELAVPRVREKSKPEDSIKPHASIQSPAVKETKEISSDDKERKGKPIDQKKVEKPEISENESNKYIDTKTFIDNEKPKIKEQKPWKEKSTAEKTKPQIAETTKLDEPKMKDKAEISTEDPTNKKLPEEDKLTLMGIKMIDTAKKPEPVEFFEKKSVVEKPKEEELRKSEYKKEKTPEDKTKFSDIKKIPKQSLEDTGKEGKAFDDDKSTPAYVKATEIIRNVSETPPKEEPEKKDKKVKTPKDKTKSVELTTTESTSKTVVMETVELLKQEQTSKEKEHQRDDLLKRVTPEKDKLKSAEQKLVTEDHKFSKEIIPAEDKSKEDLKKKRKTPEADKPIRTDPKVQQIENSKPLENIRNWMKPTEESAEGNKTRVPMTEKQNLEMEGVTKKMDQKEKSLDEEKPLGDKTTVNERKPLQQSQAVASKEKSDAKTPQEDKPKLDKTFAEKVEGKSPKETLVKHLDDPTKKQILTKKGKTPEKEEPKLSVQTAGIAKFIDEEKFAGEPSKKKLGQMGEPQEVMKPDKSEEQSAFKDDKDGRKTLGIGIILPEGAKIIEATKFEEKAKEKPEEESSEKPKSMKTISEATKIAEPDAPKKESARKAKSPEKEEFSKNHERTRQESKDSEKKITVGTEKLVVGEPSRKEGKPLETSKKLKETLSKPTEQEKIVIKEKTPKEDQQQESTKKQPNNEEAVAKAKLVEPDKSKEQKPKKESKKVESLGKEKSSDKPIRFTEIEKPVEVSSGIPMDKATAEGDNLKEKKATDIPQEAVFEEKEENKKPKDKKSELIEFLKYESPLEESQEPVKGGIHETSKEQKTAEKIILLKETKKSSENNKSAPVIRTKSAKEEQPSEKEKTAEDSAIKSGIPEPLPCLLKLEPGKTVGVDKDQNDKGKLESDKRKPSGTGDQFKGDYPNKDKHKEASELLGYDKIQLEAVKCIPEDAKKQQDQLNIDKPKKAEQTEKGKPRPKERTKMRESKLAPEEQAPSSLNEDITNKDKPLDNKFKETTVFLEFEKPAEKDYEEKPSVERTLIELEPGRPLEEGKSKSITSKFDRKIEQEDTGEKELSRAMSDTKDRQTDREKDIRPEITEERESRPKGDKRKPSDQKIIRTDLLEQEKSREKEGTPEKGKPVEKANREFSEKLAPSKTITITETVELLKHEKDLTEEPKTYETTEIQTKEEPQKNETVNIKTPKAPEQSELVEKLKKDGVPIFADKETKKKEKKEKSSEEPKAKPLDKKFVCVQPEEEKPEELAKKKRSPGEEQPNLLDQKPITETTNQKLPSEILPQEKRLTEKPEKIIKAPEKEKQPTDEKTVESIELLIHEKDQTKKLFSKEPDLSDYLISKEKPIDKKEKLAKSDQAVSKEPTKSNEEQSKLEKDITETNFLLEEERSRAKKPEDKNVDIKLKILRKPEEKDEKQVKSDKEPKSGIKDIEFEKRQKLEDVGKKQKPGKFAEPEKGSKNLKKEDVLLDVKPKEGIRISKPEFDKTKSQASEAEDGKLVGKFEDKIRDQPQPDDKAKDSLITIVKKDEKPANIKQQPDRKLESEEETKESQKAEVNKEDSVDRSFREVGRIGKPDDIKGTFAFIAGKDKGEKVPEHEIRKRIDVFIKEEKSPGPSEEINAGVVSNDRKPEDSEKKTAEKIKNQKDEKFIENETTPEETEKQDKLRGEELEKEEFENTGRKEQPTDSSSTITETLVSMAKSFFGFGGNKKPNQVTPENKVSEDIKEDKNSKNDTDFLKEEKTKRKRRNKKKRHEVEEELEEDEEEIEESVEKESGISIPIKPRRRRSRKKGLKIGEEEDEDKIDADDDDDYDDDDDGDEEEEEEEEVEKTGEDIEKGAGKNLEGASLEKPTTKFRTKKKEKVYEEKVEIEDDDENKTESTPQKPRRKHGTKRKGQRAEEEAEEKEDTEKQPETTKPEKQEPATTKNATLGWSLPAKEAQTSETDKTILFRYDPFDPKYQISMDNQPQHGVMSAPVEPKKKLETKKAPEEISDESLKPSAPTYADLFTQTSSPETSPRIVDKSHKDSRTEESETAEEAVQTETDKVDEQNQTSRRPSKDASDRRKQTTERFQQTSKPQSPAFQTTGTSPQNLSSEDSNTETEKFTEKKPFDKKLEKPKLGDEIDDSKPLSSRPMVKPEEKLPDNSFGVHVTAKVSVTQPDVPIRLKKGDKKERKRKWKDQPEEELEDVEVSSTISVQTPRDLIEAERVNIDVKPTPQTEISINVTPKEQFVSEFIDKERKFTKEEPEDKENRKGKKEKRPGKKRGDGFSKRESGLVSRKDSSPSSDDTPEGDEGEKYGIGVDVRVAGDKGDTVKREPEDEDKYKVSVDVKVKSGDTPKLFEDTRRVEIGTNIPSPRDVTKGRDLLRPEEFSLYLQEASNSGRNRVKKMQNMKNNPRVMTFMIPTHQPLPEEDIKKNFKDIESNLANIRDAISRKDYIVIRGIFDYLIKNIDDWLETVEYRVILNRQNSNEGPNRNKVNELKSLKEEIGCVKRGITDLLKTVKNVPTSGDTDVVYQLRTYMEQLEPQITEIQVITETEQATEAKNLSRWEEFLNGVNNLSVLVEEMRQNLDRIIESDGSANTKLQELEKIEASNREYSDRAVNLINMGKNIANEFPNQEIPQETYTTFETTKIIQNNLNTERERLLQLLSLADEYEQTLKEFAQIIEIADNLVESPITITSLEHLQDEMQKHRKFFVNLSHCRAILESLEGNLDGETRSIHNHLHGKLHAKASSILDKAASRAQQMALAASRWTVLDKGARNEQQWLQVAHQRLPDLQQVMSSDYDQYISLYQSLASDTAIHHAKILQLMDVANKLQDIITCVGLEKFHSDYLNLILKLQEEIQSSLEKLMAFQTMWTLYELMTNKLDTWMTTAEEDLKNLKAVPGRASMRQFWELKAQYEVHNRLRQEMGNNFEKAVHFLPINDEMIQRQILGKLEDRWKKLEDEIKEIQDSAMATLSAQDVPVNKKLKLLEDELNELNDTVDDLHGVIKTDEELNLYIERLQVLSDRLDTIQEELGRLGLLPAAESEKVGYLLGLGRRLEQQLLEELHKSTLLREKLLALQKGLDRVKRNQNSVSSLLSQCGVAETMGSDMVEQAVTNCENIATDLSEQWQDMMDLRQVLHTLPMRLRLTVSPIKVEREISQLQEVHTVLEERCKHLLNLLRNRLSMWRRFERQLEKVQQNVQETDYMVELLTLQGSVDFDRLQTATDRLKDLRDSVSEREELIKELKRLAEPLASTCNPEVAAQLNGQVDEAVTAWNDTRKNLYQIVDKYKDAVRLWKNYREARDDIRKWIDQQWHTLDLMQDKPEGAMQQIKEFKETLATQKARLDELKKLVAQIAADIGLDPGGLLECEVEDLGKRLEDVKETLTSLTSVAESRTQGKDICKDELVKAKTFLNSVQKSLNVVGEGGNENTLTTLRDHLLALGKTESQVQNVKEKSIKMNEKPHEIKSETSVVEILELWQQVFRETFQQYYRLSAKLVRSQDGAAALQLWQEYLRHVQIFLAGSLPEDYDGLRETQRLCEVHQNLLTSQQSVLSSRKDDPAIRDFSQALQEQFNSLANLHNETLTRIMDRHNEVNKRLKMWDTYRFDQSKLLSWLRDMTREQSRLQLRYIHLRRLPKLLEQIDILLSKIPQGKNLIQEQLKQQEDIVKFCDEALATSIKMETVATAERINNFEASLNSWKDFLNRVKDLYKNYESELEKVEKVCDEVTNELASPAPVSFSAIQMRLDLCQDLRNRISEYSKNIEEASVTYDQLKECLSPHDMKMLSQRLWLMGQRQGDLEHHLLLQILWLEDRLETQQAFNLRHGRFLNWANDLIKRFDKNLSTDPSMKYPDFETRAKRLEAEIQIELNLKNREYNALHAMANNIIDLSKEEAQDKDRVIPLGQNRIDYEIMKSDVERKIKEVNEVWEKLKNLKCIRLERKSKLQATMSDLSKRMEDLKAWLISIEEKLDAPITIEKSTKKCVDKLIKDHEVIQEEIEKQSKNIGEVLNLCELFLADPAVEISDIDTNEFESAMQALEKRWKAVCLSSSERKGRILGAWELLVQLSKICKEQEKWIAEKEKSLQSLASQSDGPKLSDVQKLLVQLDNEKRELDSKAPALKILDASYSKLAQESRLPAENIQQLAGPAKTLISKWHNLYEKLKFISDKLNKINKLRDDFIRNQNNSVVTLTNISAKLMQAELLPNPKKRLKEVNKLEKELERESGCLKAADETGLELMKICPEPQNVSATQKMVDEYQVMWKELQNRFADVKNKSLENLESKEIQVSTLAFETDSEVQVDTLPHMDRLTSRDAYGLELDVALRECDQNLLGLESILKASEGEPGATVPTHRTLAKIIATCTSSVELVQHLNQTLIKDCGMNDTQARTLQVNEVSARFQDLVTRAREREKQLREASERGRLTCPICSGRNWQQLENDLWRLEQWIQYAEAIQRNRPSLPSSIEALEDVIQSHRELLVDLDSHKSIIVSLNIVGDHLADHVEDVDKAKSLRERLRGLNLRWDNVCSQAAQWQGKLQEALIENPEFHDTISDLVKWLENTEIVIRNSEPVDLAQDRVLLETQYKKFKALSKELERCEPRVQSLQEAAVQVLDRGGSARERLNALRLRLTGMRRLIKVYLLRLGAVLGSDSIKALDQTLISLSQEMLDGSDSMSQAQSSSTAHTDGEGDTEMGTLKRGFRYLGRVFRASLPIQALMLLLLGAAALVPDEYYSCAFSNNARFQTYYPNGPPPI